ncbi:MAG: MtrB/PioB family outer membrane beta-barrel protein, partial [Bradyrhizobium sp.]
MINRNTLKAIALSSTCLAPMTAFAQNAGVAAGGAQNNNVDAQYVNGLENNEGEVGFGLMGVTGKNPDQAGRYNGLTTNGLDAIGQFDLRGSSPWDSGRTRYYNFTGDNLVIQTGTQLGSGVGGDAAYNSLTHNNLGNSGELNLNFGKQGTWEGGVYYDAISYTGNVIDSVYTVNGNQAMLNKGLVPWGGATATSGAPFSTYTNSALNTTGAMQPVQVGTRRDIFGGNFKYLDGDWTFTGALRHEHKEGSLEESLDSTYGGVAFALPIDYDTDRYDLAASYNTRLNQTVVQYTFSHFHDNNLFVAIPQFTGYAVGSTSRPFQETAAYSTPPSNSAHYITLMTATNMVPNTRINLNFRGGVEMQDNTFAPDTADPNPYGSATAGNLNSNLQGTNDTSLAGIATVFQGKVNVDSHPILNTDARAYYGFDGRNVSTDQSHNPIFGTGSGDSSFSRCCYAVPQNWLKQNAGVEVGYRIIPQYNTKLTVGYRFDVVDRSNAQVGNSTANTETIALSSAIGPQVNSSLSYVKADRSGVVNYSTPWMNFYGPTSTSPYSNSFYNAPYYEAPMTSDA